MRPLLAFCAVVLAAAVAPAGKAAPASGPCLPHLPKPARALVDEEAMKEAITASKKGETELASFSAYAHFLRSRLHHYRGEYGQAVDELRLAKATDPGDASLGVALAEEYARSADLSQAERELRKVVAQHPKDGAAQLLLGRVLLERRQNAGATASLRKAIALRPEHPDAYLALTQLLLDLHRNGEAEKVIVAMELAQPEDTSGYRRLGAALLERGDLPRAERLFRRALERDPADFQVWTGLAQSLDGEERWEEASDAYAQAMKRSPEDSDLLLDAGRLFLKRGADSQAKDLFDRLLRQTEEPEIWVKVAFSYLTAQKYDQAAQVMDRARANHLNEPRLSYYSGLLHEKLRQWAAAAAAFGEVPDDSELYEKARLHRASCLSEQGRHQEALALLEQSVHQSPEDIEAFWAYVRALERGGRTAQAERVIRQRIFSQPSPDLWPEVCAFFRRQGRVEESIALLSGALQSRPADQSLLFALGTAYEQQGNLSAAIDKMRAVVRLNPDHAPALNFIGYTLADRNQNIGEAERLVTRALALYPNEPAYLDSLGWVFFRRGDFARAVRTLERALALSPNEPLVLEHLGDAYRRQSREVEAKKAYQRALELLEQGLSDEVEVSTAKASLQSKLEALSLAGARR